MMRLGVASPYISNFIASSVPVGQKGLVHIWGQNNTTLEQKLGISWTARDPDGLLVDQHSDWSNFNIKSGQTHEFISRERFEFFKEGTYTIDVKLLMNPDSPIIVDSYKGALCIVVAKIPPEIPSEIPPEEEVAFPWLTVLLIGGGVALVALTMVKPGKAKT